MAQITVQTPHTRGIIYYCLIFTISCSSTKKLIYFIDLDYKNHNEVEEICGGYKTCDNIRLFLL